MLAHEKLLCKTELPGSQLFTKLQQHLRIQGLWRQSSGDTTGKPMTWNLHLRQRYHVLAAEKCFGHAFYSQLPWYHTHRLTWQSSNLMYREVFTTHDGQMTHVWFLHKMCVCVIPSQKVRMCYPFTECVYMLFLHKGYGRIGSVLVYQQDLAVHRFLLFSLRNFQTGN